MLRQMRLPLAALSLALAVSCGGAAYGPIRERATTEAELLKAEAVAINLQGEEIVAAEGFLAKAKATSNEAESAAYADLAAAYYRVALARHSVVTSGQELSVSEATLKESRDLVETYSKVLASVNKEGGAK